jgi:hypothetical protein
MKGDFTMQREFTAAPKYRKVTFSDFREWEPSRGSNGGAYGYWVVATPVSGGTYMITHFTTSDFGCCEACGEYSCHCSGIKQIIPEQEINTLVRQYQADEGLEVEIETWSLDLGKLRRKCEDTLRKNKDTSVLLAVAEKLRVPF